MTPDGAPEAVRATDSALPEVTAVETVAVAEPPCVTDAEPGDRDREKSVVVPPPPPPPVPSYGTNASVNARLFWLISLHVGRELAFPPHAWSRVTAQKASRPTPFCAAKLSTVCASASVKVEPSSFLPIIGVMPRLAYV